MRSRLLPLLLTGLVVVGAVSCTDVRDRLDDVGASASELGDRVAFCLSVTRALTATDAGSPETAASAAEELLARAPDELRDDARIVADALRAARDGDADPLADPEVEAAAERLRDGTRELCDPTA